MATSTKTTTKSRTASATQAVIPVYQSDGASSAVQCGESPNPRDLLMFPQVAANAQARAGVLGPAVAWFDAPCSSWPATASHIYAGPWNAPTAAILVIGNIFDPSTAYSSSQEMAQKLANARLLTVNGYGHTVLLNSSACASDAESAYFISGTLPAQGRVCQQDSAPFSPPSEIDLNKHGTGGIHNFRQVEVSNDPIVPPKDRVVAPERQPRQ